MELLHLGEEVHVAGQSGHPLSSCPFDEGLGHRAELAEGLLFPALGPDRAFRHGPRSPVVVVVDGGLTRGNDQVLGDDRAQEHHLDHPVSDPELHGAPDVLVRHRVAGRPEADTAQLVHLAGDGLADLGPQRGQVGEELSLGHQPLGGDGTDLRVHNRVHLFAPQLSLGVGGSQVGDREFLGDHEVGLHVADQVFDQPFRFGVCSLAKIRVETVMGGKAHIGRRGDDESGDRAAFQASHPIGQRGLGHTADRLEALGQCAHGGLGSEVVGEVHEAEPAPSHHRAKDEQGADRPQSKTTMSPGAHTPGRLPRWFFDFHVSFTSATKRRKLRDEPL